MWMICGGEWRCVQVFYGAQGSRTKYRWQKSVFVVDKSMFLSCPRPVAVRGCRDGAGKEGSATCSEWECLYIRTTLDEQFTLTLDEWFTLTLDELR